MKLNMYFLASFKNGQFDKTEEAKAKSESGKIIKIYDGDATTYLYELPDWFNENNQKNKDELLNAVQIFLKENENNMGIKGSFNIIDNELYFYIDYPSDDLLYYTVTDENEDEFTFSYIKKNKEEFWLYHQDFITNTIEEIKKECGEKYANKFLKEVSGSELKEKNSFEVNKKDWEKLAKKANENTKSDMKEK